MRFEHSLDFFVFDRPLATRTGLFALSKLGFSYLPDYFTRDI